MNLTVASLPLNEARRRFFDGQPLPDHAVPAPILHSWRRCLGLGLTASRPRHGERLDEVQLRERYEQNADWLALARPQLDTLFDSVVDDGHVVIVADRDGVILDETGHPHFLDRAERLALTPGMEWSEALRGTNAIGTALALAEAVRVRGSEHYLERHRRLSCVASPILDPFGQVLGVLDVSGPPRRLGGVHGQRLEAAVRQIELALFERRCGHARVLQLADEPALLGTVRAARLAFDDDERLCAASRPALALLGLDWNALGGRRFGELFGETLEHWQHRHGRGVTVVRCGRRLLSARLDEAAAPAVSIDTPAPSVRPLRPVPSDMVSDTAGLPPTLLPQALKLLEADIPVLVLGETGTGKDRFARALHAASSRRDGPFVAINCAALPEGLVEAELFGYEEGAYTGARRHGSRGRLREAHGGVLFLDEIGDMPLSLQARLLRVLQERVVTPLGGGRPQAVDVRLVCATHRDLKRAVAEGTFRADLYYRLCHYPLRLPPLRQRGDVALIAQQLLDRRGGARRGITLAPELTQAIRRYAWPGNVRELDNLLQTLLALHDDGTRLTPAHLPETLREDMAAMATPQDGEDGNIARQMLQRCGGNASAAARALGISRSTLYRRLGRGGH
ncbi:sigma-54-dependent Fis family transcriptional regulator [Pseudogulbenkiania subflava]|uniref:Transcriptional regulator of acetoin/glycerol metabolism n=1 Tax=Pseudogulbenkiania subflava DSM 22618 TaxID=1123014 RepID=A0A1Y6CEF2_9NEIS|nr:sigma-54-dependent Fis family transcriptional regulator [Pseudogulbenkiania subflava]SMF51416.1 Transcriptional regulator of acetoin/glycerol metabolism [Pseudogulbenkiania subflava DSM 22618]